MKNIVILLSFLLISFIEKPKKETAEFNEKIVDFAVENANSMFIELPNLCDSLSKEIVAKDGEEKLILVQILKKKGFEVTDWGRGNHVLGPRRIVLKLKKENCECEVWKTYYSSDHFPDEIYRTTESLEKPVERLSREVAPNPMLSEDDQPF